jgi:hypothetical protein
VSPVRYEQGFYIPEDDILHSHRREKVKSYIALTGWTLTAGSWVRFPALPDFMSGNGSGTSSTQPREDK